MAQVPPPESMPGLSGLTEVLTGIMRAFNQHVDSISSPLRSVFASVSAVIDEVSRERERQLAPWREAFKRMAVLHTAAKVVHDRVLEALLARGWCHSYHFTDALIVHLGELVRTGKGAEIDELMAQFTRQEFDRILATACEKYPERAAILTDAFAAHRAGTYTLSIPALLIQLDGIGCEVMRLGRYFFYEKKRAGALAAIVEKFEWPRQGEPYPIGETHKRMLSALERTWSMTLDTNLRGAETECSPLNRNGVLHGLDTDYPSEFNSLRCILLLGFVLEVRKVLHEDIPGHLRDLEEMLNKDTA